MPLEKDDVEKIMADFFTKTEVERKKREEEKQRAEAEKAQNEKIKQLLEDDGRQKEEVEALKRTLPGRVELRVKGWGFVKTTIVVLVFALLTHLARSFLTDEFPFAPSSQSEDKAADEPKPYKWQPITNGGK